jgi:hypothetical protein
MSALCRRSLRQVWVESCRRRERLVLSPPHAETFCWTAFQCPDVCSGWEAALRSRVKC